MWVRIFIMFIQKKIHKIAVFLDVEDNNMCPWKHTTLQLHYNAVVGVHRKKKTRYNLIQENTSVLATQNALIK